MGGDRGKRDAWDSRGMGLCRCFGRWRLVLGSNGYHRGRGRKDDVSG